MPLKRIVAAAAGLVISAGVAFADVDEDRRTVAMLDTAYQAAAERNDAAVMDAILHEHMIVVFGSSPHTAACAR